MTKKDFNWFIEDISKKEINSYEDYEKLQFTIAYLSFNEKITFKQTEKALICLRSKAKKEWIEKDYIAAKKRANSYWETIVKGE